MFRLRLSAEPEIVFTNLAPVDVEAFVSETVVVVGLFLITGAASVIDFGGLVLGNICCFRGGIEAVVLEGVVILLKSCGGIGGVGLGTDLVGLRWEETVLGFEAATELIGVSGTSTETTCCPWLS